MTLAEVFAREERPDPRDVIRAEMTRQFAAAGGDGEGAQKYLAARMAPRWGLPLLGANQKLSRFLSPNVTHPTMPWLDLVELLDELGLTLARTACGFPKEERCSE